MKGKENIYTGHWTDEEVKRRPWGWQADNREWVTRVEAADALTAENEQSSKSLTGKTWRQGEEHAVKHSAWWTHQLNRSRPRGSQGWSAGRQSTERKEGQACPDSAFLQALCCTHDGPGPKASLNVIIESAPCQSVRTLWTEHRENTHDVKGTGETNAGSTVYPSIMFQKKAECELIELLVHSMPPGWLKECVG